MAVEFSEVHKRGLKEGGDLKMYEYYNNIY